MRLRSACIAFLFSSIVAARVTAQEQAIVHSADSGPICTTRLAAFGGTRGNGLGFIAVDVENQDTAAHTVSVQMENRLWTGHDVSAERTVVLAPNERMRFFLPRPNTAMGNCGVVARVDAQPLRTALNVGRIDGPLGLLVTDRSDLQPWGALAMSAIPTASSDAPTVQAARTELLPADWRLYTAFDTVLVDGRATIGAEIQEALRRFVFSGGVVVIGGAERLPAGSLRDIVARTSGVATRHGLGFVVDVPFDTGDTTVLRDRLAALPRSTMSGWPAPDTLGNEQPIPGVGRAPKTMFLTVILLFAVLVGPVNFVLLRRWKRPLLVLATVPALGIGTTVAMLGLAFVRDGLGVRGVVVSWTWIDQQRHEGTAVAARTLFCGLSPSAFALSPDSMVFSPRATGATSRGGRDRWELDAANGLLDGGALPSRQPTPLLASQQGTVRQRLRVRVAGDTLEVLADGGVAPVGDVVLCDLDGVVWAGAAPTLRRATEQLATGSVDAWGRAAGTFDVVEPEHERWRIPAGADDTTVVSLQAMLARFVDGDLPRGTYLAVVKEAPWLDEHGVRVEYDRSRHFVAGRLAAEDFVR